MNKLYRRIVSDNRNWLKFAVNSKTGKFSECCRQSCWQKARNPILIGSLALKKSSVPMDGRCLFRSGRFPFSACGFDLFCQNRENLMDIAYNTKISYFKDGG